MRGVRHRQRARQRARRIADTEIALDEAGIRGYRGRGGWWCGLDQEADDLSRRVDGDFRHELGFLVMQWHRHQLHASVCRHHRRAATVRRTRLRRQ
jgi:hypothetical protein